VPKTTHEAQEARREAREAKLLRKAARRALKRARKNPPENIRSIVPLITSETFSGTHVLHAPTVWQHYRYILCGILLALTERDWRLLWCVLSGQACLVRIPQKGSQ
jgi:hypothetical protein